MTAREFLMQAEVAEKRMKKAALKVDVLRSVCEKITAALEGETVSHTKNVTAQEERVLRLMEAEEEYSQAKLAYAQTVNNIIAVLSRLEDDEQSNLLMLYHIKHKNMSEIAMRLHISRPTAYVCHQNALDALNKLLSAKNRDAFYTTLHNQTRI